MQLLFNIVNQTLTRKDNYLVVSKSQNYLSAKFMFNIDWNNITTKYAYFTNETYNEQHNNVIQVEIVNGECMIPAQLLNKDKFNISIGGMGNDALVISTNVCVVDVIGAGPLTGINPEEPYNPLLEQIEEDIDDLDGRVEALEEASTSYVIDNEYVHTDNNFSDNDKNNIEQLQTTVNVINNAYQTKKYISANFTSTTIEGDLEELASALSDIADVWSDI